MSHETPDRATKWTHDRAQEVWLIFDEEQEMGVDVSTTDVRRVIACARGFPVGRRLARKKEHDGIG